MPHSTSPPQAGDSPPQSFPPPRFLKRLRFHQSLPRQDAAGGKEVCEKQHEHERSTDEQNSVPIHNKLSVSYGRSRPSTPGRLDKTAREGSGFCPPCDSIPPYARTAWDQEKIDPAMKSSLRFSWGPAARRAYSSRVWTRQAFLNHLSYLRVSGYFLGDCVAL